jgi:hypothetical protein
VGKFVFVKGFEAMKLSNVLKVLIVALVIAVMVGNVQAASGSIGAGTKQVQTNQGKKHHKHHKKHHTQHKNDQKQA